VRRPRWWPATLWPSPREQRAPERAGEAAAARPHRAPARAGGKSAEAPAASFLRSLVVMLSASRAALWVYGREEGAWTLEREVADGGDGEGGSAVVRADGHPLTWALREGLVLQVPSERLTGAGRGSGWTLLGPVPGSRRALALDFPGSPPATARKGLSAALDHLSDLERAGYLRPS